MFRIKNAMRLSPCIFIMLTFIGCATSASNRQPEVYHPKLPAGITTHEAAIKDLAGLLENRNPTFRIFLKKEYFTHIGLNDHEGLANGGAAGSKYQYWVNPLTAIVDTNTIFVRDLMLKISASLFILYADLPDLPITVDGAAIIVGDQFAVNIANVRGTYHEEPNLLSDAQRIADNLFFIQQYFQKKRDAQRVLFEAEAAQYRMLTIKPAVSEQQRRLIVQADAFSQRQDYAEAIARNLEAIDLDPVAYPGAYFNLALLSAHVHRFRPAVFYMKQYLLLMPDARDARDAQDKIYEWEAMLQ